MRFARRRTQPPPVRRDHDPLRPACRHPVLRGAAAHAVPDPPSQPAGRCDRRVWRRGSADPLRLPPDRVLESRGARLRARRADARPQAGAHHAAGRVDGRGGLGRGRRSRRPVRPLRHRQPGRLAQPAVPQSRERHLRRRRRRGSASPISTMPRPACRWARCGATTTTTASRICSCIAGAARIFFTTIAGRASRV